MIKKATLLIFLLNCFTQVALVNGVKEHESISLEFYLLERICLFQYQLWHLIIIAYTQFFPLPLTLATDFIIAPFEVSRVVVAKAVGYYSPRS